VRHAGGIRSSPSAGVNATTVGNLTYEFTPFDGGAQRPADGLLLITTATATPTPAHIYIGEATSISVKITHPATGAPLEGVRVGLDHGKNESTSKLSQLPDDEFTDALGVVIFGIESDGSGNITIYLENETDPDNPFIIVSSARKTMTVSTDASVDEVTAFTAQVKDSNGALITGTTVTFTFAGNTYTTTTGSAQLTAPSVATSITYTITATAEGYNTPSTTIMVINVPKLTVITPSTNTKVYGTKAFTVTIADDEGDGIAGATVTFNGETYTSGANGLTELTAPDVKEEFANYDITATKTGFGGAATVSQKIFKTQGVPGFELLTLIAAIGVAFLLLRRRQK